MSPEIVTIIALVVIFAIATVPAHQHGGAGVRRGLRRRHAVGRPARPTRSSAVFPAELVLTLIGVTYLFAIAQNNGTVDLLVRGAVRLVGGHVAAIPWIMFFVTALLTAIGALSPAAVAIIAPIALSFAVRHGINPLLMGMMVIHGAQGGGFSPISVYGVTVNEIVETEGLPNSSLAVFLGSLFFNLAIALVLFFVLGGRQLLGRKVAIVPAEEEERVEEEVHAGGGGGGRRARRLPAPRGRSAGAPGDADDAHPDRPQPVTARADPDPRRAGRRRRPGAGLRPRHRLRRPSPSPSSSRCSPRRSRRARSARSAGPRSC